jgi:hypothetical protein
MVAIAVSVALKSISALFTGKGSGAEKLLGGELQGLAIDFTINEYAKRE